MRVPAPVPGARGPQADERPTRPRPCRRRHRRRTGGGGRRCSAAAGGWINRRRCASRSVWSRQRPCNAPQLRPDSRWSRVLNGRPRHLRAALSTGAAPPGPPRCAAGEEFGSAQGGPGAAHRLVSGELRRHLSRAGVVQREQAGTGARPAPTPPPTYSVDPIRPDPTPAGRRAVAHRVALLRQDVAGGCQSQAADVWVWARPGPLQPGCVAVGTARMAALQPSRASDGARKYPISDGSVRGNAH